MGWIGRGASGTEAGRRLHQRRLALLATAAAAVVALVAGTVATGPASAEDEDFGYANIELWSGWVYTIEYGQPVDLQGAIADQSASCLTFPLDCDTPQGTITFSGADHTIDYGSVQLQKAFDDPSANYATFEHTIPAEKFQPGTRYVVLDYAGNFDEFTTYVEVHITKQACHSFQVYPDRSGSKPGQPVTLTADLGSPGHTGTLTLYDQDGGVLATGAPADGRYLNTTTSALPQGTSAFYATYSGDGYYEGCTSGYGYHEVSADATPTARPDFASTTVGEPVGIDVLANDSDDGPTLRPETTNDPDFGDFELIDDTYWYTPDPDMGNYQDSFDYIVYDSIGQSSAEAHVVITVGCTPYASDDSYGTRAYTALNVTAASGYGVQRNDATCDQTVSLASTTSHGTLDLQPDGSFSYEPVPGYTGTDSFTYQYTDQLDTPVTGRAEIKVTPLETTPSPLPPLEGSTTTTSTTTTTAPTTSTTAPSTTTSTTAVPTSTTTTQPPTSTTTSTTAPTTSTTTSTTETPTSTTTTEPPTTTTSTSTTTSTTAPSTTTTTAPPPTAGQVTLASLYELLLGRSPDPSGRAHWAPKLDAGVTARAIAGQLIDSTEWRRRLVADAFAQILGRPVDPAGSAYWTDRLDREPPDALRSGLLGSSELWADVGARPAGWTDRAYASLVGRPATPDEHRVIDPAVAAGANRGSLAAQIARLDGARRHLAERWYASLLDRSATPSEQAAWATAMAAGHSERSLVAELAAAHAAPAD